VAVLSLIEHKWLKWLAQYRETQHVEV